MRHGGEFSHRQDRAEGRDFMSGVLGEILPQKILRFFDCSVPMLARVLVGCA